jgi:hypothetical protein
MKVNVDQMDASERRMILVASDQKYEELVNEIDWIKVIKLLSGGLAFVPFGVAGGVVGVVFGPTLASSSYLAATFAAASAASVATSGQQPWYRRLPTRGEIPIPHLSPRDATARYRFDPGHPKDGVAYVLDPCVDAHYILPALANERLAQDKAAAFVQIAGALGAKRIEIMSAETTSQGGSADVKFLLEQAAAQIGIGAKFESKDRVARQVFVEFDRPDGEPRLPDELAIWTDVDPSLRALVNLRLRAKPRSAKVSLRFERSIDIDARALAELASRKIEVGGAYRSLQESVWNFEVEFWSSNT